MIKPMYNKEGVIGIPANIFDKRQICEYLVKYQHLCDDSTIDGIDGVVKYIRKVDCIQYDPLDVVGRNPDLVLQSRCRDYQKGDVEKLLT